MNTVDPKLIQHVTKSRDRSSVEVLPNGQVILCWDWTVVHMRVADLLVLNRSLRSWMENRGRDWANEYILLLNNCPIILSEENVHRFCAMIDEAAAQFPNRMVRWTDLNVQLFPLGVADDRNRPCFSPN
jgi:hypothetical protein